MVSHSKVAKDEGLVLSCDDGWGGRHKRRKTVTPDTKNGSLSSMEKKLTYDDDGNHFISNNNLDLDCILMDDISEGFGTFGDDNVSCSCDHDLDIDESMSMVDDEMNDASEYKNLIVPESMLNTLVSRIQCQKCGYIGTCSLIKGPPIGVTLKYIKLSCSKCHYSSSDILHAQVDNCSTVSETETVFTKSGKGDKLEDYAINIMFFLSILIMGGGGTEA